MINIERLQAQVVDLTAEVTRLFRRLGNIEKSGFKPIGGVDVPTPKPEPNVAAYKPVGGDAVPTPAQAASSRERDQCVYDAMGPEAEHYCSNCKHRTLQPDQEPCNTCVGFTDHPEWIAKDDPAEPEPEPRPFNETAANALVAMLRQRYGPGDIPAVQNTEAPTEGWRWERDPGACEWRLYDAGGCRMVVQFGITPAERATILAAFTVMPKLVKHMERHGKHDPQHCRCCALLAEYDAAMKGEKA
jgi:hypothetical protein